MMLRCRSLPKPADKPQQRLSYGLWWSELLALLDACSLTKDPLVLCDNKSRIPSWRYLALNAFFTKTRIHGRIESADEFIALGSFGPSSKAPVCLEHPLHIDRQHVSLGSRGKSPKATKMHMVAPGEVFHQTPHTSGILKETVAPRVDVESVEVTSGKARSAPSGPRTKAPHSMRESSRKSGGVSFGCDVVENRGHRFTPLSDKETSLTHRQYWACRYDFYCRLAKTASAKHGPLDFGQSLGLHATLVSGLFRAKAGAVLLSSRLGLRNSPSRFG